MKNKLIFMLCIICVAIGGILPFVSSFCHDSYLSSLADHRALDIQKSLVSDNDVKEVLLLMSSEHDELEYNGETNISILNIGTYAKTITEELIDQKVIPEFNLENANIKANIFLVNSKATNVYSADKEELLKYFEIFKTSALVWRCDFYDAEDITYSIWIDDNSGKMVSMYFSTDLNNMTIGELEKGVSDYYNIKNYSHFFAEYYNLDEPDLVVNAAEKLVTEYNLPIVTDRGYFEYIGLVVYEDVIYFNYQ